MDSLLCWVWRTMTGTTVEMPMVVQKFSEKVVHDESGILTGLGYYMRASINRGPQNRPQYIVILTKRAPKKGPLILGKPQRSLPEGSLLDPSSQSPNISHYILNPSPSLNLPARTKQRAGTPPSRIFSLWLQVYK